MLIAATREESTGGVMSAEIVLLLRETADIVITRTRELLQQRANTSRYCDHVAPVALVLMQC